MSDVIILCEIETDAKARKRLRISEINFILKRKIIVFITNFNNNTLTDIKIR